MKLSNMRYFFLILLFTALFFACGRDTTNVGDATDLASTPAPASAPAQNISKLDGKDVPRAPDTGAEVIGRDQMAPADDYHPGTADQAEARRMTAVNPRKVSGGEARTVVTGQQAPPKQMELPKATFPDVIDVSEVKAAEVFSVRKTPCYGDCTQYEVTLYDNGLVVLEGKKNVDKKGFYSVILPNYQQSDLMNAFRKATGQGLLTLYPEGETVPADLPATILSYPGSNGRAQNIKVYSEAPEQLDALFAFVEEMVAKDDWKQATE
ncbi:MAG: hypothetical protein ACJAZ9_001242 [Neolewinella sp.]|jgi:hypothetical protein